MSSDLQVYTPKYPARRRMVRETLTIRKAQITFRNFAGKEKQYNDAGDRNFAVILNEELARELESKGWNIKPLRKFDDDDEQMYQLPVTVSYKVREPRIYMVTGNPKARHLMRKTMLPEDMLYMMDAVDLEEASLVVTGSNWEMGGRSGKKAYLQSFFGHVLMDELEEEYDDIEDVMAADKEEFAETDAKPIIEGEFYEN